MSRKEIMLDFDRVAEQTGLSVEAARQEVMNQTAREIVQNTPVKTGRLRASWFWSPTFPAIARAVPTSGISAAQSAPPSVLAGLGQAGPFMDGSLYFLNGANYAKYVEARTQFVRRVLGRAKGIEGRAIARVKRLRARFK